MSNKEFSSVEWLYDKMVIKLCNKLQTIEYTHIFLEELEQAKAMHKEEIINATIYGDRFEGCYGLDSEQYYNETFNQCNQ